MGLQFVKHTCFGNNFVIVDETRNPVLSEPEKQRFAYMATNQNFGIGSDNFLVVQACTPEVLSAINEHHHYWEKAPNADGARYIFRMFEPDGTEALSCGNGLMSIANYLFLQYGIDSTEIMTEIPNPVPRIVSIGTDLDRSSWANMGEPRRVPPSLAALSFRKRFDEDIDLIEDIKIENFRKSDMSEFSDDATSFSMKGYLVFTGEPHLVVFTDTGFSIPELSRIIFPHDASPNSDARSSQKRRSSSSAFVHFIGKALTRLYADQFPSGININFVRQVKETNTLEYRCFERGIYRETLACGTGALAVACVAESLGLVEDDCIPVWPHRCRWHDDNAEIRVRKTSDGWVLHGRPSMLCEGTFVTERSQGSTMGPATAYPSQAEKSVQHYGSVSFN